MTQAKVKAITKVKAKSFKEIDLSSYEDASTSSFKLIREDPLLSWWLSLDSINEQFEEIHKAISHTPIAGKFPILTKIPLVGSLFNTNLQTKLVWFEGKLSNIFTAYTENYNSLIKSWELYTTHIESIWNKIESLKGHLKEVPLDSDDNKLYAHSVTSLVSALTWSQVRMKINLDTAEQIRIQMKLNKPIFKTIIDSLVIEKTWEIWMRAAQNSIDTMNKFIGKATTDLTDSTIQFSKDVNANKYSTETTDIFLANLDKLGQAIQDVIEIKAKAVLDFDKRNLLEESKETILDIN